SRRSRPRARDRLSAHRRVTSSARRGFLATAYWRPDPARSAASGPPPDRRVPWSRRSPPKPSGRSETGIAPSAPTARYGWRSPRRHRHETCRRRPFRSYRGLGFVSRFHLGERERRLISDVYYLISIHKSQDQRAGLNLVADNGAVAVAVIC